MSAIGNEVSNENDRTVSPLFSVLKPVVHAVSRLAVSGTLDTERRYNLSHLTDVATAVTRRVFLVTWPLCALWSAGLQECCVAETSMEVDRVFRASMGAVGGSRCVLTIDAEGDCGSISLTSTSTVIKLAPPWLSGNT